jgi:hypothetical protein
MEYEELKRMVIEGEPISRDDLEGRTPEQLQELSKLALEELFRSAEEEQ